MPYAVAEIFDDRKRPVARKAYSGPLDVLASDDTVSRLLAQNVRHPGLSLVYNEILSLGSGSEFYVRSDEGCVGERFGDLRSRRADRMDATGGGGASGQTGSAGGREAVHRRILVLGWSHKVPALRMTEDRRIVVFHNY